VARSLGMDAAQPWLDAPQELDLGFDLEALSADTDEATWRKVASAAYPDPTQFDRKSKYYDAASKRDAPRWLLVDIRACKKTRLIPLAELRSHAELADMAVLRRGNRLSITPVPATEWSFIVRSLLKERA